MVSSYKKLNWCQKLRGKDHFKTELQSGEILLLMLQTAPVCWYSF